MGNASSSSLKQKQEQERQQALTVWMLAQEGDPAALGAFIAQIPSKLRASQLNYEEKADQRTPLAIATVLGHVDCVKLLLKAGADRNRVGRDGMGPLDLAIKTGNLTILRLLLMDAQVDCNVVDAHGYTPLLAAVVNKPTAVLELLLQCDRVNRFARHAKSGLNAIGIVCQAYEKAPSTDRIRLKARVELLEQLLRQELIRSGYLYAFSYVKRQSNHSSWERRNYQVFRTADPAVALIRLFPIGSETPSVEMTYRCTAENQEALVHKSPVGFPSVFYERGRRFALCAEVTKEPSRTQVCHCGSSTIADLEFWRSLPDALRTSSRLMPAPTTTEARGTTTASAPVEPQMEPPHQHFMENLPQDVSLQDQERSERTEHQQRDSDQATIAPAKMLMEYEAPPHPSTSRFDDTSVEEQPSSAQPPVSNQSTDCIICFDAAQSVACVPCGHIAMCMDCAQQVQSTTRVCPVCRASVQDIMKIFHA